MPTNETGTVKKIGRPQKYPGKGARITHSLRIKEETRKKLIEAAAVSNRSISEEIELRVDKSFEDDARLGPPHISRLMMVLSAVLQSVEFALGGRWLDNPLTVVSCKEASAKTIDLLMPADKPPVRGLLSHVAPPLSTRDQAILNAVEESRALADNPFMQELELNDRISRLRAAHAEFSSATAKDDAERLASQSEPKSSRKRASNE